MTKRSLVFAIGLAAALTASQARAASITSLFSTGVDNTHALLANGALDPHYSLIVSADPTLTLPLTPFVFRNPSWSPNTSTAQWITPIVPEEHNGAYNYQTTFSLAGLNPSTAVITGRLSSDDEVVGITLNGAAIVPPAPPPVDQGYGATYAFSITGPAFLPGTNTLVFDTMNTHAVVTGLFVDMAGTASVIPEPSSMALLGIGLSGLFAFRWFFKRASAA